MLRKIAPVIFVLSILSIVVFADVNAVTPSTNDDNGDLGWAHVIQLNADIGSTTLQFVSERAFWSCFEYRTDGDTSQIIDPDNYNADITDGLYPYVCENNSTSAKTIYANEYVEVRMVFGAETDERFDWTRFDVYPKDDCKNGGWQDHGFRNQGQCIRFAETGKDSR